MLKGSHHTPEARQKMVVANLARSEAHRASALAQWANPEKRAAMCASMRRDDTCRRGHPRTPENVAVEPNGDRYCRPCKRLKENPWRRARYAAKRALSRSEASNSVKG
jgi:late competence protein required for DNA uptake (superfamily II DNA/RNA helicase)